MLQKFYKIIFFTFATQDFKMKKLLTLLALAFCLDGKCQFVFTAANTNPIIGDSYTEYSYTWFYANDTTVANPGQSGTNQTWDFSNLNITTFQPTTHLYIAPTYTPSGVGCSATSYEATVVNLEDSINSNAYNYYVCTNDSFKLLGYYENDNSDFLLFAYPFSYGNSNQNNYIIKEPCTGSSIISRSGSGINTNTYDSYGTLILPGAITYTNAARIYSYKHFSYSSESINIFWHRLGHEETYTWYVSGNKFPVLTIDITQDTTYCDSGPCLSPIDYNYTKTVTVGAFNGVGIKNIVNPSNERVMVYPNPNNGSFVVEPSGATKQTMQVYDVNGKMVLSQTINGKTNIDAGHLIDGVYNLKISNSNNIVNKRIVIVK